MHDVVVVGIPLLVIIAGILFSRADAKDLRTEIGSLRTEMYTEIGSLRKEMYTEIGSLRKEIKDLRSETQAGFDAVHADLRQFYHLTGKLEGRIEAIEKRS